MTQKPRAADPGDTGSTPSGRATAPTGDAAAGRHPHDRKPSTPPTEATAADAEPACRPRAGRGAEAWSTRSRPRSTRPTGRSRPVRRWWTPGAAGRRRRPGSSLGAELEALRAELDERTRDLQRVTAEYANYRKRVDRDRSLVVRSRRPARCWPRCCRSWTTWTGPATRRPGRAVRHGGRAAHHGAGQVRPDRLRRARATRSTRPGTRRSRTRPRPTSASRPAYEVMRRGYLLGERLLRPALVAVADPE